MASKIYNTGSKEFLYTVAKTTGLFDETLYTSLKSETEQNQYLETIAGTSTIEDNAFNSFDYNNLVNPQDKFNYIVNKFYDKDNTSNDEYFKSQIDAKIVKDAYDASSGLQKTLSSLGVVVGNALNETILGTIEGISDLAVLAYGAVSSVLGYGDQNANEIIAKDVTGVASNRAAISDFARAFSYVDKIQGWRIINDVATGVGRLTVNLIPGVGQVLYFAGMAGNIAEQTVIENPDISMVRLMGYTATSTAIEFLTEKMFGDAFIKGLFKVPAGAGIARTILQTGAQEALEEGAAEIFNSLAYKMWINPEAKIATLEQVGYAALIGGLIGMIGQGGAIMTSPGSITTTDLTTGKPIDIKGKVNTFKFRETVAEAMKVIDNEKITPTEKSQKVMFAAAGLNAIFKKVGAEGFGELVNLVESAIVEKEKQVTAYIESLDQKRTITNAIQRAVYTDAIQKLEKLHPGNSAKLVTNVTPEMKETARNMQVKSGKIVTFVEFTNEKGTPDINGVLVVDGHILISAETYKKYGLKPILESIVSQEASRLMKVTLSEGALNEFTNEYLAVVPNKMAELNAMRPADKQAFMVNSLLNDTYTMDLLYQRDHKKFAAVKTFFEARLKFIKKDTEAVHYYATLVKKLQDIAVKNAPTYNDYLQFTLKGEPDLTEEEFNDIKSWNGIDSRAETMVFPFDITLESAYKINISKNLLSKTRDKFAIQLDLNRVLDETYYDESFAKELKDKYQLPFDKSMTQYLIDEFDIQYSPIYKMFMKPFNIHDKTIFQYPLFSSAINDLRNGNIVSFNLSEYLTPTGKKIFKNSPTITTKEYGSTQGGFYDYRINTIFINSNLPAGRNIAHVLSHELNHQIMFNNIVDPALSMYRLDNIEKIKDDISQKVPEINNKFGTELGKYKWNMFIYIYSFAELFAGHEITPLIKRANMKQTDLSEATGFVIRQNTKKELVIIGTGDLYGIDYTLNHFMELNPLDVIPTETTSNTLYHKEVFWDNKFDKVVDTMIKTHEGINISQHTLEQARKDWKRDYTDVLDVDKIAEIIKKPYYLFEYDSKDSKFVLRVNYDSKNDVMIVMMPTRGNRLLVKTMWINAKTDTHKTLQKERYVQPIPADAVMSKKKPKVESSPELDSLVSSILAKGGATINPSTKTEVKFKDGYQVSIKDMVAVEPNKIKESIENAIVEWQKTYAKTGEEVYVGAFFNNTKGKYDIDFSINVKTLEEAKRIGRENKQDYIYDWANDKSEPVMQKDLAEVAAAKNNTDITKNPLVNSIIKKVKDDMDKTPTRVTETQKIDNADRLEYYVLSLKNLIALANTELSQIDDSNVIDILESLFDPDLRLDTYEQRLRSSLIVYIMAKKDDFKSLDVRKRIEDFFQKYANQAGVQLSLISQIYRRADPIGATVQELKDKYGVDIGKDAELAKLNDELKKATEAKDYNKINEANEKIVARITDLIRKQLPNYDFFSGTPADKKRKFKALINRIVAYRYLAMLSNPSTHLGNYISNYGQKQVVKLDKASQTIFEKLLMQALPAKIAKLEAEYDAIKLEVDNHKDKESVAYQDLLVRQASLKTMIGSLKNQTKYTGAKASQKVKDYIATNFVDNGMLDELMFRVNSKYDHEGKESYQRQVEQKLKFRNKILQKVYDIETWSLEGVDAKFVGAQVIKNLEDLIATNFGDNIETMTDEDFQGLIEIALRQSMELYFRNKNAFSTWWTNTMEKHWLLKITMGGILPFQTVASNILVQIYKHSPIQFATTFAKQLKGNINGENQFYAELARSYGQATTGTLMMITGLLLNMLGVLRVDEDEKNGVVLQIGEVRIKLSELAPSLSPMLLGAALISENPGESLLSNLYEQTLLGNMNSLFQYNYSLQQAMITSPLESYILQYIPSLFKSVTKIFDPAMKDTSGQHRLLKRIASSLPLISNLFVPNKKDPYTGEDYIRSGLSLGTVDFLAFFNTFNPIKVIYDDPNYLADRAKEIGAEAGQSTGRFVINKSEIELSGRDLEKYSAKRGEVIGSLLTKLFASAEYKRLTDEEKKLAVGRVYDKATQYAKIYYWLSQGNKFVFQSSQDANEARRYLQGLSGILIIKNHKGSRFVTVSKKD